MTPASPTRCRRPSSYRNGLTSVLATLYLIFNEGYFASRGDALIRTELADEAIRLARVLVEMLPGDPEAEGAPRPMLLQHSRRDARLDESGEMVLLGGSGPLALGPAQITRARAGGGPDRRGRPYSIQARIAAEHARAERAEETDWRRIGLLYGAADPGPALAGDRAYRAIAVAMDEGPGAGLELIDAIEGLDRYAPFHVSRADLLAGSGGTRGRRGLSAVGLSSATNPVAAERS